MADELVISPDTNLGSDTTSNKAMLPSQIRKQELESSVEYNEQKRRAHKAFNANDLLQYTLSQSVGTQYDFVKVNNIGEHGTMYYRAVDDENHRAYKRLRSVDSERIVSDKMREDHGVITSQKVKSTADTLKVSIGYNIEKIDDNLIELNKRAYWDMKKADIIDEEKEHNALEKLMSDDKPIFCMRSLFDSENTDEYKVGDDNSSDGNGIITEITKHVMHKTLEHLKETDGVIIPDDLSGAPMVKGLDFATTSDVFSPFWTWANSDIDTFNDLLKAVASNFMEHKPKGAFVLIGLKRNGKSTFVKMLHMLFGRNNTSMVRLSDFNNHGLNGDLWTTMMNAPDEEDEGTGNSILEVQGNFKSIAAHEALKLRRLYAQNGQWVNSNFMCFFPMNHFPEWQGTGAAACMQRTLPLFFDNDLSKYDNNGRDFAKETFTPWFFTHLLGVVFGIAQYYHHRPLVFSEKMQADKERVRNDVDSVSVFIEHMFSYFDGYSNKSLVYSEYAQWCLEHDIEPQSRKVLGTALDMRPTRVTTYYPEKYGHGYSIHQWNFNARNPRYFYRDAKIAEAGNKTVEDILVGERDKFGRYVVEGRSVLGFLDECRDKEAANIVRQSRKNITPEEQGVLNV